jgi:hypothetical protein
MRSMCTTARSDSYTATLVVDLFSLVGTICKQYFLASYQPMLCCVLTISTITNIYCHKLLIGGYRELAFQQSSTRDQIELLELQLQLEAKLGASYTFVDRSLADTIFQLICLAGEHSNVSSSTSSSSSSAVAVGNAAALSSEALRLAKRFKVTAFYVFVLMVTASACYCFSHFHARLSMVVHVHASFAPHLNEHLHGHSAVVRLPGTCLLCTLALTVLLRCCTSIINSVYSVSHDTRCRTSGYGTYEYELWLLVVSGVH